MAHAKETVKDATAKPPSKEELDAIEEDDEFEEFDATGRALQFCAPGSSLLVNMLMVSAGGALDGEDLEDQHQWEDDWDTEDVDDQFSKQLR